MHNQQNLHRTFQDHHQSIILKIVLNPSNSLPGGYFEIRRSGGGGGLDLTSSLEAKFGARFGQVHQIRGKFGKFCHHKTQKLGKSPNFGVISEIRRVKFGVFVTYIFGGKIWGSNKNFRGKFWGQAPPTSKSGSTPWEFAEPGAEQHLITCAARLDIVDLTGILLKLKDWIMLPMPIRPAVVQRLHQVCQFLLTVFPVKRQQSRCSNKRK